MARSLIGWMIFQILVGIWLLISPFVLGFRETTRASIDSMAIGVVVVLIALGMSFYNERVCGVTHPEKKTF